MLSYNSIVWSPVFFSVNVWLPQTFLNMTLGSLRSVVAAFSGMAVTSYKEICGWVLMFSVWCHCRHICRISPRWCPRNFLSSRSLMKNLSLSSFELHCCFLAKSSILDLCHGCVTVATVVGERLSHGCVTPFFATSWIKRSGESENNIVWFSLICIMRYIYVYVYYGYQNCTLY